MVPWKITYLVSPKSLVFSNNLLSNAIKTMSIHGFDAKIGVYRV